MRKPIKVLILLIMCMLFATACDEETKKTVATKSPEVKNGNEEIEEIEETQAYVFGYSCIAMDTPYFVEIEALLREQVEGAGHTFIMKDAQYDAQLQEQQIDELIAEGVDAVYLIPVDWIEITPALDKLKEAGVKVINLETKVQETGKTDAYVGTRNKTSGKLCGEDLVARVPQGGKVVLVECTNRSSINARIQGFEKGIRKTGFEVIARIDSLNDVDTTLQKVTEVLTNDPDVVAIMCGDDHMALRISSVAHELGLTDVVIYGVDGSPDVKNELLNPDSLIAGTAVQLTKDIVTQAFEVSLKVLKEEKISKNHYTETYLINKENVTQYDANTWQ